MGKWWKVWNGGKSILGLGLILVFANSIWAKNSYEIDISSDKDVYSILEEEATFSIDIKTKHRKLKHLEIKATYPDSSTEVTLDKGKS